MDMCEFLDTFFQICLKTKFPTCNKTYKDFNQSYLFIDCIFLSVSLEINYTRFRKALIYVILQFTLTPGQNCNHKPPKFSIDQDMDTS